MQAKLKRQINDLGPPILIIWDWSLKFGVGVLVLKQGRWKHSSSDPPEVV